MSNSERIFSFLFPLLFFIFLLSFFYFTLISSFPSLNLFLSLSFYKFLFKKICRWKVSEGQEWTQRAEGRRSEDLYHSLLLVELKERPQKTRFDQFWLINQLSLFSFLFHHVATKVAHFSILYFFTPNACAKLFS